MQYENLKKLLIDLDRESLQYLQKYYGFKKYQYLLDPVKLHSYRMRDLERLEDKLDSIAARTKLI